MFYFSKAVAAFILPPGLFIVLLFLSGAWLFYRNHRKAGGINLGIGLLIWLFSLNPFANFLTGGLESKFNMPKDLKGDVIILLGGGIIDEVPDLSGYGIPSDDMLGRIITAVRLQKKLQVPIIVSGGKVYKRGSAEAHIVRRFLIDLGVAESRIIVEDKSRNTYENAKYTREICSRYHYEKPVLVTSGYHLRRSLLSFEKIGLDVIPFPANFKSHQFNNYRWYLCLPSSGSLALTAKALHEYTGILYYKLVY